MLSNLTAPNGVTSVQRVDRFSGNVKGLVTVKIGLVALVSLAIQAAGWAVALIMQVAGDATVGSPDTIVSATALTGTAGALVYVVRQMASGKLVHRDPATAEKKLADALDEIKEIAKTGQRREETLYRILVAQAPNSGQMRNVIRGDDGSPT